MTPTPAALILDFGGVMTTDLWESIRACARREGLPPDALLELLRHDTQIHQLYVGMERGDVSQADFEVRLAAAAGLPAEGLLARMCADLRPDEAILSAVAALRATGVRIGVLSNSWGTGYFSPYQGYDLEKRADALVFSDQVRLRKPEPEIFTLMLDRLGVDAASSVFIDDVAENLPPAEALGVTTIHHVDSAKTVAALESIFIGRLPAFD
jgi:epoxide hydrolase-like predicted phosphatase